ncbi:flavodoxin [Pediococcus acidilactici]|jgi:flavodoxin short chain|uniref:flavodoxin n=1 Tax=Pediococcus acidilactici TaxID=1254 RepID=UPI0006B6771D|nr:flavodoxin [Pediococcus acidilactici]KAF0370782.1 flavodoxin [Pediococcus acidilactici]KAF0371994.1 flavodoxin [Pediococcus acidilactici]KAF0382666.1 flavodoxin [Pediococcus acidilactici]KAF0389580.1 flavodoxin [Pediococcus acidilactici]KAF0456465.1 flavodoxin [Pediococcus acidilactici]
MPTAKVVFATITGNNEDCADIITEALEDLGVEVDETEISQTDAAELKDYDINVIVPYTYDEGALPEEGLDFYDDLAELDLSGKIYGVAGSGDTFYEEFYCVAVDKFSEALTKANATKGTADLKINLAPESQEDLDHLDQFAQDLVDAYNAQN